MATLTPTSDADLDTMLDFDPAGSILQEIEDVEAGRQMFQLTTLPNISTFVCATSRHDVSFRPQL